MPPLLTHWFTTGQAGQLHAAGGGGDDVGAKAGPPHLAGSGGGDDAPDAGQTCASNGGGAAAAAGQPQVSNPDGGTGADSVYRFVAPTAGTYRVELQNLGRVQYGAFFSRGTCSPVDCAGTSTPGSAASRMRFIARSLAGFANEFMKQTATAA